MADPTRFSPLTAVETESTRKTMRDGLADPMFREFHAVWAQRCDGDVPARKFDILPTDFSTRVLPHLLIVDVSRNPLRFLWRLTGTIADSIHGRNLTGVFVDEMPLGSMREMLLADFEVLVATGESQFAELLFTNADGRNRRYEVMRLPMLGVGDSTTIDHILVMARDA